MSEGRQKTDFIDIWLDKRVCWSMFFFSGFCMHGIEWASDCLLILSVAVLRLYVIWAINIRTALMGHNSLDFHLSEMIFSFLIIYQRDQAGSCIFIRLEMRAKWRKHLLFASTVGQILWLRVTCYSTVSKVACFSYIFPLPCFCRSPSSNAETFLRVWICRLSIYLIYSIIYSCTLVSATWKSSWRNKLDFQP